MNNKNFNINTILKNLEQKSNDYKTPIVDLIEAQTKEPWKVLVATILSARTNDSTTAMATTKLFKKISTIDDIRQYTTKQLEKIIYPVGFFRNKAKFLTQLPNAINEKFNGNIPDTIDELIQLPGVGRKTANLVVAVGFHKPAICVDTHVHRIMNIWGYVHTKTPLETEMALRKKLPKEHWINVNYLLVSHGQSICRPISPICSECVLNKDCPKINITPRKTKSFSTKKSSYKNLQLISWNVNGVRAIQKKGFIEYVKSSSADVIALQETKAQKEQLTDELLSIEGYSSYWFSAQKKGYSGVAIYSKLKPISVIKGIGIEEFDNEGRVLTSEFETFFLVNCYYPNSQHELKRLDYKLSFNKAILSFCNKLKKKKTVIICGDFNVAHKPIDLKNPKPNEKNPGYSIEERNSMDTFINTGYRDTFRIFNTSPDNYTWWSYRFNARERNIGWRIDYFCVNDEAESRIISADIHSEVTGSDHCPIGLVIKNDS